MSFFCSVIYLCYNQNMSNKWINIIGLLVVIAVDIIGVNSFGPSFSMEIGPTSGSIPNYIFIAGIGLPLVLVILWLFRKNKTYFPEISSVLSKSPKIPIWFWIVSILIFIVVMIFLSEVTNISG